MPFAAPGSTIPVKVDIYLQGDGRYLSGKCFCRMLIAPTEFDAASEGDVGDRLG
jgi:hypothetical protein